MQITLIRNATMKIKYNGKTILTDPMLSSKGVIRSFAGIAPNPIVELPMSIEEITDGIDFLLVSHTHPDHFDDKAGEVLNKTLPIYCQSEDEIFLKNEGFVKVIPIHQQVLVEGIEIIRTAGLHGKGPILEMMGTVSGFVLKAQGEPIVYWVGDSILCDEVRDVLKTHQPEVIITHSGGAIIPVFEAILMDAEETIEMLGLCPEEKVVAIHMDSLDHCLVTREILRNEARAQSIDESRLLIPENAETIIL